ncbi:MAG: type III secretion system chaperone [Verrucomicrobia bacterium]|nr:type III secretion system chaperone [Verrucomicrobiota bacterium]
MDLSELVQEFGRRFGIDDVGLNAQGACNVVFDGKTSLFFESVPDQPAGFICAELARFPDDEQYRLRLFDVLMEANYFGLETGDGAFAASRQTGRVVFFKKFTTTDLSVDEFILLVRDFTETFEYWRNQIEVELPAALSQTGGSPQGEEGYPDSLKI